MASTKRQTFEFSENAIRSVALYARVSTCNGQQDPEMQLAELREYVARSGLTIHQEIC